MTIQISIVGLGQIGTSIGLALAHKEDVLVRVGHDRERKVARQAEKMGAVDRVEINLPKAVQDADLVLLSLPIDQIEETMEIIGDEMRVNAVLMDTGSIKEVVSGWAEKWLPDGRHYVGLTPVINPIFLHSTDSGIEAARAELFERGLMAIVVPPNTNSEAVKLAADLTRLLGSAPLFVDPAEMDGLMAATHVLPQLMAAALLNATVDQPGWREARKVAGRAYAEVTGPIVHLDDSRTLSATALMNRENVLRVLDSTQAAIQAIRDDIVAQDESGLNERLGRARAGREKWWKERQAGEWVGDGAPAVNLPEDPGFLGRLFGIGRKPGPREGK
jgi:prephenate dehydrogenase